MRNGFKAWMIPAVLAAVVVVFLLLDVVGIIMDKQNTVKVNAIVIANVHRDGAYIPVVSYDYNGPHEVEYGGPQKAPATVLSAWQVTIDRDTGLPFEQDNSSLKTTLIVGVVVLGGISFLLKKYEA